jgi:hypothetical protein
MQRTTIHAKAWAEASAKERAQGARSKGKVVVANQLHSTRVIHLEKAAGDRDGVGTRGLAGGQKREDHQQASNNGRTRSARDVSCGVRSRLMELRSDRERGSGQ